MIAITSHVTFTDGVKKLRAFLEENGISKREAARAVGVASPTMLDWLRGRKTPTQAHRRAIRIWTKGKVNESDWESERERKAALQADSVEPFEPSTGTDGGR